MYQTSTKPISNLMAKQSFIGGICKFWFVPVRFVESIPAINPTTQYLSAQPVLIPGESWIGPCAVPDQQLGFTETPKNDTAGLYYELKVEASHPGDSSAGRVNYENMQYEKYLIVAKLRSGEHYILIGSIDSPLDFDAPFSSGTGSAEDGKHKIAFTGENIYKSLVIPSFTP